MSGLSLWLSPPTNTPFNSLLNDLSNELSTVHFNSHVTLVSDKIVPDLPVPDILKRIEEGVKSWKREEEGKTGLELLFKDVRQGALYYQCVLIALEPTLPLFALHESLLRAFSQTPPSSQTYFPHLSLVYGDLTSEKKDEIIKDLKVKGIVRDLAEGGVEVVGQRGFEASEILLARTGGAPETWEILGRVGLDP